MPPTQTPGESLVSRIYRIVPDKDHAEVIVLAIREYVTRAKPPYKTVTVMDLMGGAGDYNNGIKDYQQALLAGLSGDTEEGKV